MIESAEGGALDPAPASATAAAQLLQRVLTAAELQAARNGTYGSGAYEEEGQGPDEGGGQPDPGLDADLAAAVAPGLRAHEAAYLAATGKVGRGQGQALVQGSAGSAVRFSTGQCGAVRGVACDGCALAAA